MGLAAKIFSGARAGENPDHCSQTAIGSCLEIERRISHCHHFRHIIDLGRLHRVKEHKRGGPPLRDVITGSRGG